MAIDFHQKSARPEGSERDEAPKRDRPPEQAYNTEIGEQSKVAGSGPVNIQPKQAEAGSAENAEPSGAKSGAKSGDKLGGAPDQATGRGKADISHAVED